MLIGIIFCLLKYSNVAFLGTSWILLSAIFWGPWLVFTVISLVISIFVMIFGGSFKNNKKEPKYLDINRNIVDIKEEEIKNDDCE
jgi:uncharacterized membrane protein